MGRGIGEASTKVGVDAKTFYDTQVFQYGVRDKSGYALYQPSTDKEHPIFPQKPDIGLFIKPWEFRHKRLVAEVDAWRRQELLKEEMLIQMSKLKAVERQRCHFHELKRQLQLEQLQWSRPSTAKSPNEDEMQKCKANNGRPSSVEMSSRPNSLRGGCSWRSNRVSKSAPVSARCSVISREELEQLSLFERKHGF